MFISPSSFSSVSHTHQTFCHTSTQSDSSHIRIYFGFPVHAPTSFLVTNKTLHNLNPAHISGFISHHSPSHSVYAKYVSFYFYSILWSYQAHAIILLLISQTLEFKVQDGLFSQTVMLPKVIGSLPDILLGTSKLFSKPDKTLKVFDILKCSLETLMKKIGESHLLEHIEYLWSLGKGSLVPFTYLYLRS